MFVYSKYIQVFKLLVIILANVYVLTYTRSAFATSLSTGFYPVSSVESYVPQQGWSGSPDSIKTNDNQSFVSTYPNQGNSTYMNVHIKFPHIPQNAIIDGFNYRLRAKHDGGVNTGGGASISVRRDCSSGFETGYTHIQSVPGDYFTLNFNSYLTDTNFININDINNGTACFLPRISTGPGGVNYYEYFEAEVVYHLPDPTPTPTSIPSPTPKLTPAPFLGLPFNYNNTQGNQNKSSMDFSTAANAINSYFDHKYPFLCCALVEPPEIVNYNNELTTQGYTSHDGYDYGISAQVKDGDPVLAAAAGDASLTSAANSFGAGNVIKIDHGNGYETIYEHMYYDNYLPVKTENTKVHVEKGQRIGTVGHFGNCWVYGSDGNKVYNTPACAHLHFGLVRDKNNDGNFNDNIPDGLSDPFGWEPLRDESSKDSDPWENYSFNYAGQQRTGVKSFYLWTTKLPGMRTQVDSTGGSFSSGKASIVVPPGTFTDPITLEMHDAPAVKASNSIWSVGPSVEITAKNLLGDAVTLLTKPVVLWWAPFKDTDVSRFKFGTLSVFSSNDGTHWTKEQRIDPYVPGAITTAVSHFTYFAVMGERKDITPPVTNIIFDGEKGSNEWFRSDVNVTLSATDSADEDPAGVADTYYKLDGADWQRYSEPLSFSNEGEYHVSYYSEDNDGNIEDIKTVTFHIDKTVPQVTILAEPNIIWSPNGKMVPVTITGKSDDEHLLKTTFNVQDEYNSVEPTLSNFGQTINLEASRNGDDLDGRVYTIQAIAEDLAGNKSTATTTITVPHDNNITN